MKTSNPILSTFVFALTLAPLLFLANALVESFPVLVDAMLWQWFPVVAIGLVAYLSIAMLAGCPYCMHPNLGWPLGILEALVDGVRSRVEADDAE